MKADKSWKNDSTITSKLFNN